MLTAQTLLPAAPRPPHVQVRGNYAIILTSGPEDGGKRATLAFSAAVTAQSMDLDTLVFLVGDGAHWGYEGHAAGVQSAGFPALADLMETYFESGGQVVLCSACDAVCAAPGNAAGEPIRRLAGVRPKGMASVLSHAIRGSSMTF